MAGHFTKTEWNKIDAMLDADPAKFGMPEGGREKSLVLASFNIRKLSSDRGRKREIDFMARFCANCDLIAVQEVQDNLDGLFHLKERMESRIAEDGGYGLVVSDITGQVPGEKGMAERLAFLYRRSRIRRLAMASDLTVDLTSVLENVFGNEQGLIETRREFEAKMKKFLDGKRKTKPTYVPPSFVTFVRTPFVAAFEAPAANDQPPLRFSAVNAHLVYGTREQREAEFEALISWLTARLRAKDRLLTPSFILLGDLNLDVDLPDVDRVRIAGKIRAYNEKFFGDPGDNRVYFPFIDKHPASRKVIRTNARLNQTFDQIAVFRGKAERRLPDHTWLGKIAANRSAQAPDGYNFDVFNFSELFAQAVKGQAHGGLSGAQIKSLGKKFEHSVSDHMPIWMRIPRPGF